MELQLRNRDEASVSESNASKVRTPKLLAFIDDKDNMDSYLDHFERFGRSTLKIYII